MIGLQAWLGRGLEVIRARPFNHTGPGQRPDFVVPALARQVAAAAAAGRGVLETGNLDVRRDITDVRDVVRAYRALLELGTPGEVYNVCRGEAVSIEEVARRLVALAGVDLQDRRRPGPAARPSTCPTSVATPPASTPPPVGCRRSPLTTLWRPYSTTGGIPPSDRADQPACPASAADRLHPYRTRTDFGQKHIIYDRFLTNITFLTAGWPGVNWPASAGRSSVEPHGAAEALLGLDGGGPPGLNQAASCRWEKLLNEIDLLVELLAHRLDRRVDRADELGQLVRERSRAGPPSRPGCSRSAGGRVPGRRQGLVQRARPGRPPAR